MKLTSTWRPFYHVPETRQLFRIENLHPPEHSMTPAVFRDVVKETLCILTVKAVLLNFNLLATDFFFQILAHPVFKM